MDSAKDGAEAISLYEKALQADTRYAAVIMDLTIPGGMGGKEAIGKLLKIDPGVTAIVSSGYSKDPVMATYREHGFSGVLAKPFKFEKLAHLLEEVTSARKAAKVVPFRGKQK